MRVVYVGTVWLLLACGVFAAGEIAGGQTDERPVPTHAAAAVILARQSGFFDRYVADDATLTECVAFLNRTGIYFGLAEVVSGRAFSVVDCARTMGQLELVFSGEAEYIGGKVILPKGIDSWVEFCAMNDVHYMKTYQVMKEMLYTASGSK